MLNVNFLKEKILSQKALLGIWSIINSPMLLDIGAHAGLDFQILDMEHGVVDFTVLDNCIRACESMNCSPLVRVPGLNLSIIQSCLDMGAHGIIVPQVNGYDDALKVVQSMRFAPDGSRGFNPFTRANAYNPKRPPHTTKLNHAFPLTSVIIETVGALNELDKILTISGLDMLYLGIYDLSFALGLGGNTDHPDILDIVNISIEKIKKAGKLISLMVKNQAEMQCYIELGVALIVCGVDTHIYLSAIETHVKQLKEEIKSKI